MAYNHNFTHVELGTGAGATVLFVGGTSDPPEDVIELSVAMPRNGALLTSTLEEPGADWEAQFDEGEPPFEIGEDVFVVGVALRESPRDPFVWEANLTIESR